MFCSYERTFQRREHKISVHRQYSTVRIPIQVRINAQKRKASNASGYTPETMLAWALPQTPERFCPSESSPKGEGLFCYFPFTASLMRSKKVLRFS
jgi:hypothetical protein